MAPTHDLSAWYDAESPVVRRYLIGLTKNPELAEDLTQETFVQALVSLRGYRGGDPQAYLIGIARRVHAGHARRAQRERLAQERGGPAPRAETIEAFADGQAILPDLSPEDRRLVIARGVWGMPFADIAQELGRSENWSRVRYFRLIARLRGELAEEGGQGVRADDGLRSR